MAKLCLKHKRADHLHFVIFDMQSAHRYIATYAELENLPEALIRTKQHGEGVIDHGRYRCLLPSFHYQYLRTTDT